MFNEQAFLQAIDDNLLCFDNEAKEGELTPYLICFINQFARTIKIHQSPLIKLWLPNELIIHHRDDEVNSSYVDSDKYIYGMTYEEYPLDIINKHDKFYVINNNDKYLIIGELENGKYVLGSC